MTDPNAPKTVTPNDDQIVDSITETNAARARNSDYGNDDRSWIETVVSSFNQRSPQAQQALLKALCHGHVIENPAGLTTFLQQSETVGEPSPERSETSVVYTVGLHNRQDNAGVNTRETSSFTRRDQGAKRIDMVE